MFHLHVDIVFGWNNAFDDVFFYWILIGNRMPDCDDVNKSMETPGGERDSKDLWLRWRPCYSFTLGRFFGAQWHQARPRSGRELQRMGNLLYILRMC